MQLLVLLLTMERLSVGDGNRGGGGKDLMVIFFGTRWWYHRVHWITDIPYLSSVGGRSPRLYTPITWVAMQLMPK